MLQLQYQNKLTEAGCDEAGRGCLAGPVFAAAVVLPPDYKNADLNDSKKLSHKQREKLRVQIIADAVAYAVASVSPQEIDKINILNASILAMHKALGKLKIIPQFISVDGNRFKPYKGIPHVCVVKGDGKLMNIAAASILAKTYRDDFMLDLSAKFPQYLWQNNKGYATRAHVEAIIKHGSCVHHRKSFTVSHQLKLSF